MTTPTRPKELPYEPQSAYALVVFGLRFLFQLWPFWVLGLTAPSVVAWWTALAYQSASPTAIWAAPFVRVAYAALFVPLVFTLKKISLASWNSVDAAMAGLILTLVTTTLSTAAAIAASPIGFNIGMLSSPAYLQLLGLGALTFILLIAGYRGPMDRWLYDLVTPIHKPQAEGAAASPYPDAPNIVGTIKAPPPAELRDIDPEVLSASLKKRVIGQDVIANQLSKAVARRMAQQRRGKPVFTGLFAGPTGVGKTEMAKAVAVGLLGSEKTLFRVDCGNVLGEAGLQTLIGAPTGYMGSDKPGALTAHVLRFPNSVLLFDEIEKAMGQQGQQSPLFRLLLSLLDEGRFTEQSTGANIDATGCVILMTSNAAHKALGAIYEQYKEDAAALTRATKDELQSYFAPEFLARIDLVTSFSPLDTQARGKVIAQHIGRIARQYDITVTNIDAGLVSQGLVQWQALESYGAREILRWLEDAISDAVIDAKKKNLKTVNLQWKDGAVLALPAQATKKA